MAAGAGEEGPPATLAGSDPPAVLGALLQSLADAVYLVDHEGIVRFANAAALDLLGWPEEQLVGRPSHAAIHHTRPDGRPFPEAECPLLRPRLTGEVVRVWEDWFVRRDGQLFPVSYSSAPVATADGLGAVVVFRDVSDRRAGERTARAAAVERARAEELERSRIRIVEAADAERRRIGRDLHDGAQQRLMNVALGVRQGISALDERPDEARAQLAAALDELRATLAELRDLAAGIHPSILTNRGLAAAVDGLTGRMPLPVRATIPDVRWPAAVEATAYFVIAEALANVTKHAGASLARVDVEQRDGRLLVTVADDGRGGADPAAGRGLQGLGDRVAAHGGTLAVAPADGGGSELRAVVPLPPAMSG
ncbi:sensor histidine kinase [Patulibacter defluvii]|uniref:sensor histidine kinase n=1 Tax=Patulibacter defluvii TaxID=3095358 RepID=UPI002A74DBC5|nr:PAS domain-containing protein [Patulibacter sp. DM4]